MGRLIHRAILCLALGVACAVTQCWLIAAVQAPGQSMQAASLSPDLGARMWSAHAPPSWTADGPARGWDRHLPGRRWIGVGRTLTTGGTARGDIESEEASASFRSTRQTGFIIESHYGWPWPALRARALVQTGPDLRMAVDGGLRLGDADELLRLLDLRALAWLPLWEGLVGNSLLIAGVLLTLMMLGGLWRRQGRRRRGLCPHCGYDLRGEPIACPECGRR